MGADSREVVSDPSLGSQLRVVGLCGELPFRSKRTRRGSRWLAVPLPFSARQASAPGALLITALASSRQFRHLEVFHRLGVSAGSVLPSPSPAVLTLAAPDSCAAKPTARAAGEWRAAATPGAPRVSTAQPGPRSSLLVSGGWKITAGWSRLRGISVYASRSIFGIAAARILGLKLLGGGI